MKTSGYCATAGRKYCNKTNANTNHFILKFNFFLTLFLGPVIGLEFNSKDCVRITNEAVSSVCGDSLSNIYVSPSPEKASQDIDAFYNFVDMSMT